MRASHSEIRLHFLLCMFLKSDHKSNSFRNLTTLVVLYILIHREESDYKICSFTNRTIVVFDSLKEPSQKSHSSRNSDYSIISEYVFYSLKSARLGFLIQKPD